MAERVYTISRFVGIYRLRFRCEVLVDVAIAKYGDHMQSAEPLRSNAVAGLESKERASEVIRGH